MNDPSGPERLQKLLAAAGHGSRRQIETWIRAGRITVDGRVAQLGDRAGPAADVRLDGKRLALTAPHDAPEVLVYYKPVGEICSRRDPEGRPSVFDRLPPPRTGRWVAIGRLDFNTSGLLLFTTDGALAHELMHPSREVEREYLVRVRGRPRAAVLERLRTGVELEDGPARFNRIEPVERSGPGDASGAHAAYRVVLREGRKREVRRLWEAVGHEVSRLCRLRYGPIELPSDLHPGQSRRLSEAETRRLYAPKIGK